MGVDVLADAGAGGRLLHDHPDPFAGEHAAVVGEEEGDGVLLAEEFRAGLGQIALQAVEGA